jgi:gamma-aminobutyric acid receptor subunit beta
MMIAGILVKALIRLVATSALGLALSATAAALQYPPQPETRDVEIEVYLLDINEVDSVSESFTANVSYQLSWRDPSLAHGRSDSISKRLDDVWHPRIQLLNQRKVTRTFPESVEIRPDGTVLYRQRLWGSFSQPVQLIDFPFDTQRLGIIFTDVGFGSTRINLTISPESGIHDTLQIADWAVTDWDITAVKLPLGVEGGSFAGAVFSLDVSRRTSYFILKVILPLVLIVLMSWLIFWIDPSMSATQISVSVTAMLTLIAYRFAIGGMLPRLGFLTSMDYFVLASTVLVFLSLIQAVTTSYLSNSDRLEQARALDRKSRWGFPLAYLMLVSETLYFRMGF